jgi:hypothetical protein
MRWLITPLQAEHGLDCGTVVDCFILSASCLEYSISPSVPFMASFLNQSKAWQGLGQ